MGFYYSSGLEVLISINHPVFSWIIGLFLDIGLDCFFVFALASSVCNFLIFDGQITLCSFVAMKWKESM